MLSVLLQKVWEEPWAIISDTIYRASWITEESGSSTLHTLEGPI